MEYPTIFSGERTALDVLEVACAEKNFEVKSVIEQVSQQPVIYKHVLTLAQNEGRKFTAAGHGSTRKEAGEIAAMKLLPDILTTRELLEDTSMWNLGMQTDHEKKALLEQSRAISVARTSSVGAPESQEIMCVDQVSVAGSSSSLPSASFLPRNPVVFIDGDNVSNEDLAKLIPKEFDYLLEHFEDPVEVLETICEMIEAEVKFTSVENSPIGIMCNVILKADGFAWIGDGDSQVIQHAEIAGGIDRKGAMDLAARRMLKYFRSMLNFD